MLRICIETYVDLHVGCSIFMSCFNENCDFLMAFSETPHNGV